MKYRAFAASLYALVAFAASGLPSVAQAQPEKDIQASFAKNMKVEVTDIRKLPFADLYEVLVNGQTIAYTDAKGEVVLVGNLLDVRTREQWPITPETCDAGLGGVGWRDDVQLVFAMRCDGADAQLYLASKEVRSREVSDLLRLTDFEGGATDAFTAVRTGIVAYVRPCTEADCGDATEVWVSELDLELSCRLTRSSGGVDRHPAFNVDLSAVTYARDGRTHRIGLNVRALYGGEAECGLPGTDVVLGDDLWDATEGAVEDHPQMATAGGLLAGAVLFVERAADGRGRVRLSDRMGTLVDLTPPTVDASYARWVVDAFDTSGER